jgi:ABC-type dipeptide/oligopeptide/nickel transport system permease subunit
MTDVTFAIVIGFILGLLAGYFLNQGSLGFDTKLGAQDQEEH